MLIADLFGADEGVQYEVFARGPDLGVDLRYEDGEGGWHVVQCKHYLRSTVANLRTAARDEVKKLARLDPQPVSYRFVTSRGLTTATKRDL
jgi:Restriction endonuclease